MREERLLKSVVTETTDLSNRYLVPSLIGRVLFLRLYQLIAVGVAAMTFDLLQAQKLIISGIENYLQKESLRLGHIFLKDSLYFNQCFKSGSVHYQEFRM